MAMPVLLNRVDSEESSYHTPSLCSPSKARLLSNLHGTPDDAGQVNRFVGYGGRLRYGVYSSALAKVAPLKIVFVPPETKT
jgi:hypothetical protein